MTSKKLMDRLRTIKDLTGSEEKILRFFESHYPLIAFETIHSISEKCNVGKATVSRFVSRLGYGSFSDFMTSIRDEVSSQLDTPIDRFSSIRESRTTDPEAHYNLHAESTIRNIEITRNRIDPAIFEKAVSILSETKGKLYIIGDATSYGLAYFFYMLATYMRSDVILLEPGPASLSHNLIDVTADDALLAILHYRFSNQTVQTATWFSECGAAIVLLSDRIMTPISDIADVQLYSSSEGPEMFNSRISTLFILETLLASMAPRLEKDVYGRFSLFEKLRSRFGVFAVPSSSTATESLYESDGNHSTHEEN